MSPKKYFYNLFLCSRRGSGPCGLGRGRRTCQTFLQNFSRIQGCVCQCVCVGLRLCLSLSFVLGILAPPACQNQLERAIISTPNEFK